MPNQVTNNAPAAKSRAPAAAKPINDQETLELVTRLCKRGDKLELVNGKLAINTASGQEVPKSWLNKYEMRLIKVIADLANKNAFIYSDLKADYFAADNVKPQAKVKLNFVELLGDAEYFAYFNVAAVTYTKGKKKGQRLPANNFLPLGQRSELIKFANRVNLKARRPSELSKKFYLLKQLVLTGITQPAKQVLDNATIYPLSVSYVEICSALSLPKTGATNGGRHSSQASASSSLEQNQSRAVKSRATLAPKNQPKPAATPNRDLAGQQEGSTGASGGQQEGKHSALSQATPSTQPSQTDYKEVNSKVIKVSPLTNTFNPELNSLNKGLNSEINSFSNGLNTNGHFQQNEVSQQQEENKKGYAVNFIDSNNLSDAEFQEALAASLGF